MIIQPLHAGLTIFALGILVGMAGLGLPVAGIVAAIVAGRYLLAHGGGLKRCLSPASAHRHSPAKEEKQT